MIDSTGEPLIPDKHHSGFDSQAKREQEKWNRASQVRVPSNTLSSFKISTTKETLEHKYIA